LLVGDLLQRYSEHLGGGGTVDIAAGGKGGEQALVAGQVRHDAQLDLRVVGRKQLVAGRCDEGLADTPALLGTHRDVLQVGIGRRQPAGGSDRLVVGGVHPAGVGIDQLRQL